MSLQQVLGQPRAIHQLKALLAGRQIPPALLFHGPEGVGKSLAAFEFAKALHCETPSAEGGCGNCGPCLAAERRADPDLQILNAEYQARLLDEEPQKQQHIKIEAVRHLIQNLELHSFQGAWKIAILEKAHTMQAPAANALLKSLEEPPPKTLWILLSSRRELLLPTILSRCHSIPFQALSESTVRAALESRGIDPTEAGRLAARAEGSPGRAMDPRLAEVPPPETWISDPMAPFALAEGLPKELHLSRPLVEEHLRGMAWHLRRTRGIAAYIQPQHRRVFYRLAELASALKSNADPRIVLQAAALEIQGALSPFS